MTDHMRLPVDWIGAQLMDIPTPALVVDWLALKKNIAAMQAAVSAFGKALRPHIKTHKCSKVAQLQLQAGAIGVTCATVGEAEAMARVGVGDILLANQMVTPEKLVRLARLMKTCSLKFAVDSLYGIEAADAVARQQGCVFEVLVEVNIGGQRCGAETPAVAASLVRRVRECRSLRFGGIQAYCGGTSYIKDIQERQQAVAVSDQILRAILEAVQPVCAIPRVSGAGTGNAAFHLQNNLLTEIQAGSYVYSDTTYRERAPEYPPALFVLATLISRPVASRIVLDVGLKGLGTEFSAPELVRYPHLRQYQYSEEHLQWQVDQEPAPEIGEKVLIIPSHCCTTVNLHRHCFVMHAGRIVDVWPIDAF